MNLKRVKDDKMESKIIQEAETEKKQGKMYHEKSKKSIAKITRRYIVMW